MKKILLAILLIIVSSAALMSVAEAADFSGGLCANPKPAGMSQAYYDQYCAVYGPNGSYTQWYCKTYGC